MRIVFIRACMPPRAPSATGLIRLESRRLCGLDKNKKNSRDNRGSPWARRKLRQPSKLIEVVLPRPLGIIFEEDTAWQRVVVSGFIPGSHADQLTKACLHPAVPRALTSLYKTLARGPHLPFSSDCVGTKAHTDNATYKIGTLFLCRAHVLGIGCALCAWEGALEALWLRRK